MGQPMLRVVYASSRYVVVDKPAGLLSVPGKGEENRDCVPARVRAMFPGASGPLVVHRLDMDTSGLVVMGLDAGAQRELSRRFERREVKKRYVALVHGIVREEEGVVEAAVRADLENRPHQVVDAAHGRPARTAWRVLAYEGDRARVELSPQTGRTHQLRVHCAHMGHPIVGDVLYGPVDGAPRLMLHASRLAFVEPGGAREVSFESPAPF